MSVICTSSGVAFDVAAPEVEMVNLEDIAHALAHTPRFGGHAGAFYSVAAHSVAVSYQVPQEQAVAALLHDAAEAYLGDIPTPIKRLLPDYQALYSKVEEVVARRFGVATFNTPEIKEADAYALAVERAHFLPWTSWWPMVPCAPFLVCKSPEYHRAEFLKRAKELGLK